MIEVECRDGHIKYKKVHGELPELRREMFQIVIGMDKILQKYGVDNSVVWFRRAVKDYLEAPETYGCIEGPKDGS